MTLRFLTASLIVLLAGAVEAEEFSATVSAVLDGDTVLVLRAGQALKVRLAGIDAPEIGHGEASPEQAYGEAARRSLAEMVLHRSVQFRTQAVDQYGRLVAELVVSGRAVNAEQVRRGLAWEYSLHHNDKYLILLENEARSAARGLWVQSHPIPPWEWRRQHPNTRSVATVAAAGCGDKHRCAQMTSCEEARHYLNDCGVKSLDGDGDGVPCAQLCR